MKSRFTADLETLLYLASGLCVAIAIGILITPKGAPQGEALTSNIIESTSIDALATPATPDPAPGRVSDPVRLDTPAQTATPEELLQTGKQELAKGNGRQALDALLKVKESGNASPDVMALIAEAYNAMQNFDQAATEAATVLRDAPGNTLAKIAFAEAKMHQAGLTGNDALLDEATNILATVPQEAKSAFLGCIIATYRNNTEMQDQKCEQAKQSSTTDARIASDILGQKQLFSTFRDGNRSYIDLLHAKSVADAGFYDLSSVLTRRIVEQHRDYRDAWVVLGYDYIVMEKYSLAQVALETAYSLDKTQAHIQYLLGIAYDKQQDKEKAVTFYMLALDNQYPNKTALRQRVALLLTDLQKFDLALKQYVSLVNENALAAPEMYVTPIWLALEYVKDTDTAWALAQKAKEKFPDSAVSDNLLGWVALGQGKFPQAEQYLRAAIQKKADYDAPWYNLGRVLEGENRPEDAKNAYNQAYTVGKDSQIARLAAESYNRLQTAPSAKK